MLLLLYVFSGIDDKVVVVVVVEDDDDGGDDKAIVIEVEEVKVLKQDIFLLT